MATQRAHVPATEAGLGQVLDFVDSVTSALPAKAARDLRLATEEVGVNIVSYGFPDGGGSFAVTWNDDEAGLVRLQFDDDGIAFDPLALAVPDLTVPMAQRQIGGLGIMMVRKLMDDVHYARVSGRNVLTLTLRYEL
jgi:anti-sigma regulatory factor (Ser/Thr protein kinase)